MASPSRDKDDYGLDFLPKDQADKLKKMYDPEFFTPHVLRHFREFNIVDRLLERKPTDSVLVAPLMQVLSITLHKDQDDGIPFEIYGTILIDDGEGPSSLIFNCVDSEPQRMHNGGRLMLSMPKGYRSIRPSDKVNIKISLYRISNNTDDKNVDIVVASDRWDFKMFSDYDISRQWRIEGAHGYVLVDFVVYRHAISVTVDATLLKRKEDNGHINIAHMHGTMSARCGNDFLTSLFYKEESEPVMVKYGSCIELSSAVVVAPVWAPLVIEASLWNRHPKKIIVDGEANDFHAIKFGMDSRIIEGEDDFIKAEVEWMPACWDHPAGNNTDDSFPVVKKLRITPDQQPLLAETISRNLLSDLRKSLEQTDWPQLEVFSISIHNSKKDKFSVWGSVTYEDFYSVDHFLFRKEKTAAERLLHNQTIPIVSVLKCMKGPLLSIFLDLKDDEDCVICYGEVAWGVNDLDNHLSSYNKKLCSVIQGDDGYYAAVYYSIFNGGVQALVKVYLIDKSSTMKYTKVYGSVRSQYSGYEYLTIDDDELYSRKLYARRIEDFRLRFARRDSQSKILLSESCVSVPIDSALYIDVDLNVNSGGVDFPPANYTHEILRSTAEHLKGRAIFSTGQKIEYWASEESVGHRVEVTVEWKTC